MAMKRRWGAQTGRQIAAHFVWTVAVAALLFKLGSLPFQGVLLFNAGVGAAFALIRRQDWRARDITLWDEAVAFVGVCGLARLVE